MGSGDLNLSPRAFLGNTLPAGSAPSSVLAFENVSVFCSCILPFTAHSPDVVGWGWRQMLLQVSLVVALEEEKRLRARSSHQLVSGPVYFATREWRNFIGLSAS